MTNWFGKIRVWELALLLLCGFGSYFLWSVTQSQKQIAAKTVVVLDHANTAGDGHAGWAAIADHWEPYAIACTLARATIRRPDAAVKEMQRVADEIIANRVS